jgi:hypothetical protein
MRLTGLGVPVVVPAVGWLFYTLFVTGDPRWALGLFAASLAGGGAVAVAVAVYARRPFSLALGALAALLAALAAPLLSLYGVCSTSGCD